jgi:hypothetical protein
VIRSQIFILKIVWFIFFVVSIVACSYLIAESVNDYLEHEVTTKTRILNDKKVPFPRVTICFQHTFTTDFAYEFLKNAILKNNLSNIFDETVYNQLKYEELRNNTAYINLIADFELNKANFSDSKIKSLSTTMHESLIGFNFNSIVNFYNASDFFWMYKSQYGNCYAFNSGKNEKGDQVKIIDTTSPGKLNGLRIEMYVHVIEKLRLLSNVFGLYLNIDDAKNNGLSNIIEISAGFETNIAINREYVKQLPKPFSNCDLSSSSPISFSSKLYDMFPKLGIKYKQSICFDLCYQTKLKEACNCLDPVFDSFYDLKSCYSSDEYECLYDIFFKFIG